MSAAFYHLRLCLRQRALLFWSFFVPVFFMGLMVTLAYFNGRSTAGMSLLLLLGLSSGAGVFLASAQREILSKPQYFLVPAVRRGMNRGQLVTGILVAVCGVAAMYVIPGLQEVVRGEPAVIAGAAALMVLSFTLTLLVVFLFAYAAWLPFQVVWLFAVGVKPLMKVSADQVRALLGQTSLLTAAAAIAAFFVWQMMSSRTTHRRLAEEPFISIADLKNSVRLEDFKRSRNLHRPQKMPGDRFLSGMFQGVARRINATRQVGQSGRALVWEAFYLTVTTLVPRRWWTTALVAVMLPAGLVVFGYMDSRAAMKVDSSMQGWFSGLLFIGLVGVMAYMAYPLRVRVLGCLTSRGDLLRAGGLAAAFMLAGGLLTVAGMYALGHGLAAVVPPITIGDRIYTMIPPRAYILGLPIFGLPLQLIVFILWRRPRSHVVLSQSGTVSFFTYHAAFAIMGVAFALPFTAAVAATAWLALPWVWRWRVLKTDLI